MPLALHARATLKQASFSCSGSTDACGTESPHDWYCESAWIWSPTHLIRMDPEGSMSMSTVMTVVLSDGGHASMTPPARYNHCQRELYYTRLKSLNFSNVVEEKMLCRVPLLRKACLNSSQVANRVLLLVSACFSNKVGSSWNILMYAASCAHFFDHLSPYLKICKNLFNIPRLHTLCDVMGALRHAWQLPSGPTCSRKAVQCRRKRCRDLRTHHRV